MGVGSSGSEGVRPGGAGSAGLGEASGMVFRWLCGEYIAEVRSHLPGSFPV